MSDITTAPTWPAGWYEDPFTDREDYLGERWWDGKGWQSITRGKAHGPVNIPVTVSQVVTIPVPRKRVNHILHLLLTIFTAGLWLPVWIIIAMARS